METTERKLTDAEIEALSRAIVHIDGIKPPEVAELVDRRLGEADHFGQVYIAGAEDLQEVRLSVLEAAVDIATANRYGLLVLLLQAAKQEAEGQGDRLEKLIFQLNDASMDYFTAGVSACARLAGRLDALMPWTDADALAAALLREDQEPDPAPEPTCWKDLSAEEREFLLVLHKLTPNQRAAVALVLDDRKKAVA